MLILAGASVVIGAVAASAQLPPALQPLPLETYPEAAREALSRAYRAARRNPEDAGTLGELGRTLHAWEQWDAAREAYARARTRDPRAFDWPYLEAVVLQRLARHQEAVGRLREALQLKPDYLPARVRLAEALLEAGELDESGRLFESLTAEAAAEPAARVGLGRIAGLGGRHDRAVAEFQRALALFPELAAAHYGLARSYRALGRTEDATRALADHARYGARWPRIDDPVLEAVASARDDGRAHLQRGVSLAGAGDVEGAIAAHEAALARDPQLAQAHANLVSLYGRARNWEKAELHYGAAVDRGLDLADLHYDFGLVLASQERWEEAAEMYRKALRANPQHAPARNNLGQLLERDRDFTGAAAEYRQAVDAQPGFRLARFNLGRMLLALGDPEGAVAAFEPLVEPRDEEAPRYLFGLATAHVRAGRRDEGVRLAHEARELAQQHGQPELAAAIDRELARLR